MYRFALAYCTGYRLYILTLRKLLENPFLFRRLCYASSELVKAAIVFVMRRRHAYSTRSTSCLFGCALFSSPGLLPSGLLTTARHFASYCQ